MDPQLLNLLLDAIKQHGAKLEAIASDVTVIKTTLDVGDHEKRIQKLEVTDWYARVGCKAVGIVAAAAALIHQLGVL